MGFELMKERAYFKNQEKRNVTIPLSKSDSILQEQRIFYCHPQ